MRNQRHKHPRFAIAITHTDARNRLIGMPWLGTDHQVDESDSIVLSHDGWQAIAEGEPAIWDALERKLLIGFYVSQPDLIAVVGHPPPEARPASADARRAEVRAIARRVRSLLLPATVTGFWVDEGGSVETVTQTAAEGTADRFAGEPEPAA